MRPLDLILYSHLRITQCDREKSWKEKRKKVERKRGRNTKPNCYVTTYFILAVKKINSVCVCLTAFLSTRRRILSHIQMRTISDLQEVWPFYFCLKTKNQLCYISHQHNIIPSRSSFMKEELILANSSVDTVLHSGYILTVGPSPIIVARV